MVQFLTGSTDQYCQEVLILHYLQRASYVEAIRLNEKLKQTVMVSPYIYTTFINTSKVTPDLTCVEKKMALYI